ncbi:MAG: DUF1641 domain-containing protein [Planctomycetales bacterium]|nr:DUF1641 domain-containing protein [Planctomycetales bacterium]MCA9170215.1 DUF1641 domain-containing protein [Planctomycetales bacterium]
MSTLTHERPSLADRLQDPQTVDALQRLLDRSDQLNRALDAVAELPNLIAIATDVFDATVKQAAEQGVDVQARAGGLLGLLKQLTEPANLQALNAVVTRLPQLAQAAALLDELPNLLAIATDVFDEWVMQLKADGIELEASVRNGLQAMLYLGGQIQREELDRLGYLLKSGVLSQYSVETVGMAGSALSSCRRGTCEHPVPKRVGLLGMLGALRDPNTQRTLSFALQFSKCFGSILQEKHSTSSSSSDLVALTQDFQV